MSDQLTMTEDELRVIQVGNAAAFVAAHMRPILDATERNALGRLKTMQRNGMFDASQAQSEVAALCLIDELRTRLASQVNQGEGTAQAVEGRGPDDRE